MKNPIKLLVLGSFIPFAIGCAPAGITVGSDAAEDSSLSEFRTYSWLIDANDESENQNFSGSEMNRSYNQETSNADWNRSSTSQQQVTASQTYTGSDENSERRDNKNEWDSDSDQNMLYNAGENKKTIKKAIETQLEAKGFSEDKNDPDMLVSYRVVEKDERMRTFNRRMGTSSQSYIAPGPMGTNVEMVDVPAGSILLNFLDAESGDIVWQGFASKGLEPDDVRDEETIKAKIGAIFEEFNFSGFTSTNNNRRTM